MGPVGAMRAVSSSICVLACAIVMATALADEPFNRQVRIIVPVAAGSSLDARARVIAHALGERLKLQPIVENKPGAGGTIGSAYVAKAPPDGTTLPFTNDSVVINPHVYRDPGYDALKDLAPITQAYTSAMVLVAYPGSKATSEGAHRTGAQRAGGGDVWLERQWRAMPGPASSRLPARPKRSSTD